MGEDIAGPAFERMDPSIRKAIFFLPAPIFMYLLLGIYPAVAVLLGLCLMYNLIPEVWYLINQRPIMSYMPALEQVIHELNTDPHKQSENITVDNNGNIISRTLTA